MEGLQELLRKSTVKILSVDHQFIGSGFFINNNKILTALHNVQGRKGVIIDCPAIQKSIIASVNESIDDRYDFAVLDINLNSAIQASYIGTDFSLKDSFIVHGYSESNKFGDSVSLALEGETIEKEHSIVKYKVKLGQIDKGISGAPVLSIDSGQVVGIIIETRDRKGPAGGYFISIKDILKLLPNLLSENRIWHLENPEWNYTKNRDSVHNIIDDTWNPDHFNVFPNENVSVEDIHIDPEFHEIIFGEEFEKKPFTSSIIERSFDLLTNQNVLMITGPYGSGKTLLTKCIQKRLIKQGCNTLYIAANNISNDKEALKDLVKEVRRKLIKEKELHVVFDAFDELNSLDSNNVYDHLEELGKEIQERGGFLIINFRSLESQNYKDQYEYLCMIIQKYFKLKKVHFLKLKEFTSENVRQWQNNYTFLMQNRGLKKEFTPGVLYSAHKNLIVACHNPLFLYIVSQDFYKKDNLLHSISNIYDVYETFVQSTVKGKFSVEAKLGSLVLKKVIDAYITFLKEMSIRIAGQSKRFTIREAKDLDDHLLDDNTELFGITDTKLAKSVEEIISSLLPNDYKYPNLDHKLLNCYFFEQSGNVWRFRDNNILFFFLAEKIFTSLIKAINLLKSGEENTSLIFEEIKNISKIPLHPVILEMLLNKLKSIQKDDKKSLVHLLRLFIDEECFLSISTNPANLNLGFEKINLDIFLCILFIQLNENGYNGITFFFKRYMWLLSLARRINPNMVFLAKRFYKGAKIYGAEFRRVNLKGCNFDESDLKNVSFIQNKIHDVRNNNSVFENVKYLLCDFKNSNMDKISGDIHFDNCAINILSVEKPLERLSLVFERCRIKELKIFNSKEIEISLTFRNCIIDDLFIKSVNKGDLYLEYNFINSIKVEKSKIYYSDIKNIVISDQLFKNSTSHIESKKN